MIQDERINYLTEKFFAGNCSEIEKAELATWISQNREDEELSAVLESAWQNYKGGEPLSHEASERILVNIFPDKTSQVIYEDYEEQPVFKKLWPRIAAAAVLVLGLGLYWWSAERRSLQLAENTTGKTEIKDLPPGGNKAILTLGDGTNIVLDSAGNGNLANQGNTSITKSGKGELIYSLNGQINNSVVFNTVATPKGGQYHIVLPDGSKVWLNAASSLRFPTAFKSAERRVEITGEVYFEVTHNPRMPFIVKAGETEVTVLGTHFNIMAYPDEKAMKTTLLEGSVKVSRAGKSAMLTPGQQAKLSSSINTIRVLTDVDTDKEMAWKNGYFQFEDENLEDIMRQVSRWYDVEVTYEGNISREHFTGRLPRNANVSKVLKILSLSGVKFRIEDQTIIVTP